VKEALSEQKELHVIEKTLSDQLSWHLSGNIFWRTQRKLDAAGAVAAAALLRSFQYNVYEIVLDKVPQCMIYIYECYVLL
jgi:hypothetical protein